ncbi:MAG: hypothetical protein AAGH19_11905, partial [Pseudomonadota bacterium]
MLLAVALLAAAPMAAANIDRRTVNDGQMVLENVPPIPASLPGRLDRFQQLSSTQLLEWAADGVGMYVRGRYRGVAQVQRVAARGATPERVTRLDEPVREVQRQHQGELLAYALSEGGRADEQLFLLNPGTGDIRQLTDTPGAINNRMVWDREDQRLAFRSTQRNGASNDIWLLDIDQPDAARLIFEAPDGALWRPVSFSRDNRQLLVQQYTSITDSRIHLLDL